MERSPKSTSQKMDQSVPKMVKKGGMERNRYPKMYEVFGNSRIEYKKSNQKPEQIRCFRLFRGPPEQEKLVICMGCKFGNTGKTFDFFEDSF